MPVNVEVAQRNHERYIYARDNGHLDYVRKADKCDDFYQARQWDETVRKKLERQGKPVLTINQTLATISLVQGELLNNLAQVTFKPAEEGDDAVAHALSRTYLHVAQKNRLYWVEQDVADDGFITSRGFYDCRVNFDRNLRGHIDLRQLNPRNVVIDADADSYDPDEWNEVFITSWMSPQQIALKYNKADADILKTRPRSDFMFGVDTVSEAKQTFGGDTTNRNQALTSPDPWLHRHIRVIERQYWERRKRRFFVDRFTGDTNPVPDNWEEERISRVALQYGLLVVPREDRQIRWTVTADSVVLHDGWSPYEHFTVVPYFPYFRRGQTIGLVENLISPQEQLNKTASQELHIINTTANSGWKAKKGALGNMTAEELEQRGGETGLVIEYTGDDPRVVEKIQPNQVPTGIDRVSTKSEGWIKTISGVSDSMRGFDREDVSGRAIEAKQQRGSMNLAKPFDNLMRTRHLLAERVKRLIQTYYTEPRVLRITGERPNDPVEDIQVNQPTANGRILNDLTIGKYDVVLSTRPPRESYDQAQFEQVASMRRDLGVKIPDKVLIEKSDIENKEEVLNDMNLGGDSAEQQRQAEEQQRQREQAESEAKIARDREEAALASARADKVQSEIIEGEVQSEAQKEAAQREHEARLKQLELDAQIRQEQMKLEFERQKHEDEMDFKEAQMEEENRLRRLEMRRNDQSQSNASG